MKYDQPPTNLAGYDPTRDSDGFVWRADKARNVIEFFCECLHLTSGRMAGKPFVPQAWQQDYLATLFGWLRSDGTRRYRESLFFTPRKQGKSELGAGIALYLLCCDGEAKPEVYSAANTREQATRIFEPCSIMVRGDATLRGLTRVIESTKRVLFPQRNGYLNAISADAATAHGKNPHGVLFDELHTQPNRRLYDGLKSGMGARTQPLFVSLTTAGCDRESICYEVWRHAVNVRDGVIADPHFLPLLYQFEDGDDWSDVEVWRRVNPSLGVTITEQFLKEQFERASTETSYENTFRNLYLNQWCVTRETNFWREEGLRVPAADLRVGDVIVSFDEHTHGLVKGVVGRVAIMPPSAIYRIRTARGRIVRVTGEHPFWCRSGPSVRKSYGWKTAKDLIPGDRVMVALDRPTITVGSNRRSYEDCYMLGIMIGDGTCKGTPRLTTADQELVKAFTAFAECKGDAVRARPDGWHYDVVHAVRGSLKSTNVKKWLKRRGVWGKNCYTKRIPECVWKAGRIGWAAFISGYLDTDGHVSRDAIVFTSCNRELLSDCQDLLAYLGIQSDVRDRPDGARGYRLEIRDAVSFLLCKKLLTPKVGYKSAALDALKSTIQRDNSDRRAFDRVADVIVEPAEQTIGVTVDGWHTHVTNGLITHNTEQEVRWLSLDAWDKCGGAVPTDLDGEPCWVGLDMGSVGDLSAVVLAFPRDGKVALVPHFFVPEEGLRRRGEKDRVPYLAWRDQGLLTACPGRTIGHDWVKAYILRCRDKYQIMEVAADPWNCRQMLTELEREEGLPVNEHRQGMVSMNGPAKAFERHVLDGKVLHGGNPILRWMAGNVTIERDASENIKPVKAKSTGRIDGIVAAIMALGRCLAANESSWYYASNGLEVG